MTAFYSTAQASTAAIIAEGALISWGGGVIAMAAALDAAAGASAPVAVAMSMDALLEARGGIAVPVAADMAAVPDYPAAGGIVVAVEPETWTFASAFDGDPAGGAWAGLVTDELSAVQFSTAQFSTAGSAELVTVRVPQSIAIALDAVSPAGGANTPVDADMNIEPNDHGPVARPRKVAGQTIMS